MHSHLLQVFLVTCLVLPCLGTALKEERTRKGRRTKVEHDTASLVEVGEGEAVDDSKLTTFDDKNDERESGNEKRGTRKGKRTRVEQDTDGQGEEEIAGYDVLVLSEDKDEGSAILNSLEAGKKGNEKRGTRKGKRTKVEQDTDRQGEEATGDNVLMLSGDKKEELEILNKLEAERKRNEKRATRKGKRANI